VSEDLASAHAGRGLFARAAVLESPSLFRPESSGAAPPAYEIKFLLTQEEAKLVEERVRGRLAPDPHADPALGGAYRTTSLYTDTPEFEVFRRVGEYGRSKFRVRRYGSAGPVFLERKDKNGDKVRKCRASVPPTDLAILSAKHPPKDWVGGWFGDQIGQRRLAPVCRITYDRVAYLGAVEAGTVRVTFDTKVRGELARKWEVIPVAAAREVLPGRVVCEFKYRAAMPLMLKEIVESLGLQPTPCSKYRYFLQAAGVVATPAESASGDRADG
jgi:hypothetical protein